MSYKDKNTTLSHTRINECKWAHIVNIRVYIGIHRYTWVYPLCEWDIHGDTFKHTKGHLARHWCTCPYTVTGIHLHTLYKSIHRRTWVYTGIHGYTMTCMRWVFTGLHGHTIVVNRINVSENLLWSGTNFGSPKEPGTKKYPKEDKLGFGPKHQLIIILSPFIIFT